MKKQVLARIKGCQLKVSDLEVKPFIYTNFPNQAMYSLIVYLLGLDQSGRIGGFKDSLYVCLLYTSDAADE